MNSDDLSIFDDKSPDPPLAEIMRPKTLDKFVGQKSIVGKNSLIQKMIETNEISSFILWGPPGVGKTTLAKIIANTTDTYWKSLSAVLASIKDAKSIMEDAEKDLKITGKKTILFIDEIHRFNKAQQDAFLPYVEQGKIILIGATTENPSFSIISPLLSRMRVIVLKRLKNDEILILIKKAIEYLKNEKKIEIELDNENMNRIVKVSSGDARRAYGIIELSYQLAKKKGKKKLTINKEILEKVLQGRLPSYDKKGDYHFDYISALHKSMRNSDVDASIYYAVKMLESGEDPMYIIRRIIRFSSEDVGLADPNALIVSMTAKDAIMSIGMPEANLSVLQAVVYNALAPKSNALYEAYKSARDDIKQNPDTPVPFQIRNAPTDLMKEQGYGKGYKYAHEYEIPIADLQCLPDIFKDRKYYNPKLFGFEKKLKERMEKIEEIKKKIKKDK